jgi:hypothetical protein
MKSGIMGGSLLRQSVPALAGFSVYYLTQLSEVLRLLFCRHALLTGCFCFVVSERSCSVNIDIAGVGSWALDVRLVSILISPPCVSGTPAKQSLYLSQRCCDLEFTGSQIQVHLLFDGREISRTFQDGRKGTHSSATAVMLPSSSSI